MPFFSFLLCLRQSPNVEDAEEALCPSRLLIFYRMQLISKTQVPKASKRKAQSRRNYWWPEKATRAVDGEGDGDNGEGKRSLSSIQ